MKKQKSIIYTNQADLKVTLENLKSATTATISYLTEPKIAKSSPFHGRVKKITYASVIINFIYANSVNAQRAKENLKEDSSVEVKTFVPHARKWGVKIPGTPLVEHNGAYYLEARFVNPGKSVYLLDGKLVDKSVVALALPVVRSNAEHQGIEAKNEVILRDIKLENIAEIKMIGSTFKVI